MVRGGANYDDHHGIGILAKFSAALDLSGVTTDHINRILPFE
jgi:hypothetical protein